MPTSIKLLFVNLAAVILILATVAFPSDPIRILLGVPFLLFFPGYAFTVALMPGRYRKNTIQTIAFSAVLSLALVPLLGLLLNYAGIGIRLEPVLYTVAAFTLLFSVIAWVRLEKSGLHATEMVSSDRDTDVASNVRHSWTLFGIAAVIALAAMISVIHFAMAPKSGEEFTSFYLVTNGDASPAIGSTIKLGEQGSVTVAVLNHEGTEVSYRIELSIEGQDASSLGPFTVSNGEEWNGELVFTPASAGVDKVELLLYKAGEAAPYLKPLYFWVTVGS